MADDEGRVSALRATAHPVRLRILSLLTGTAMSAAEVARELGLTHANASYHLRTLVAADELVEAGEERIRGGVAKRYRYPHERRGHHPDPARQVSTTDDDRVAYARASAQELERRVLLRRPRRPQRTSDLEGWVDEETWTRALDLLEEASMLLHEANRPPRTPGTLHVSLTTWAFEMRSDEPPVEQS
ncbi:ArsR/SmtB family transcription factor [Nocardioides litoris]|uniref:ArsR/SmtB family transcription factor n=1 Tax=Nocardioides litoris TaxID=1926648 RepID=UPI0011214BA7|nr:helix-turn-helix domain-containing protein [Nocardioides litoris]